MCAAAPVRRRTRIFWKNTVVPTALGWVRTICAGKKIGLYVPGRVQDQPAVGTRTAPKRVHTIRRKRFPGGWYPKHRGPGRAHAGHLDTGATGNRGEREETQQQGGARPPPARDLARYHTVPIDSQRWGPEPLTEELRSVSEPQTPSVHDSMRLVSPAATSV